MSKFTCKSLLLAALIAGSSLLPIAAQAAGLGKLTVLSSLGQPLRAEIEIVSLQAGEVDTLNARLASPDAFRQANIELNGALLGMAFAIERRAGGQFVVTMTSTQPMNEPFIDALVELNWTGGRLVREYTFLLDPPEYKGPAVAAAPVVPPAAVQPAPAVPQPSAAPIARAAPAVPAAAPAPAVASPSRKPEAARPAATYEVKRGDTLAKIARDNTVAGATLQQMLAALYRGNRDAFDGDNMNRLRAGRILNLPDREAATAISQAEAQRLVSSQSSDFAAYRRGVGAAVAEAAPRADTGRQASGRIGAPPAEVPPRASAAGKDQLRLSRADDAKAGGRAAAAQDDAASKDKALKEANERIALLEKNLADLQKLAQLKSQTGAQLQQQAQAGKAEAAKAPATAPAPAAKAEPAKPEPAKPEPAKPEAAKAAAPAPAAADAGKAPPAAPAAAEAAKAPDAAKTAEAPKPAAAAPKPAPKPVAPPPPPPPPDMLEELLDNPLALGGAGGVVVLLAGYAFYAVRRRRKLAAANSAAAAAAVDTSSMLASSSMDVDTGTSQAPAEAMPEAAVKADAEEIDPIAEADVYMAYGRDAQAEEILKEALAKDSTRQPVRLKLLEVYANRKDATSFAKEAAALHAATGGQGAEWEKAAQLGAAIDPGNLLYGGAAGAAPAATEDTQIIDIGGAAAAAPEGAAAPVEIDFDLGAATEAAPDIDLSAAAQAEVAAPAEPAAEAPTTLDFDLDLGGGDEKPVEAAAAAPEAPVSADPAPEAVAEAAPAAEAGPAVEGGLSIDFDLPAGEPAAAEAAAPEAAPEAAAAAAPADEGGLSIDFDLGTSPAAEQAAPAAEAPAPAAEPALDLSGITLDLGAPASSEAPAADPRWQEVATKLDLAKAYQEMGDKDGARELLNEVVKEGDSAQQQQARSMLETIG